MSRYRAIYRDGKLLARYEGGVCTYVAPEEYNSKRSDLSLPYYVRDIGAYKSPIDGSMITSRSAHRDHLKTHGVIEVGNERLGAASDTPRTRDIGETIKRRIEEVKALPQSTYDQQVREQAAEHAQIAAKVT